MVNQLYPVILLPVPKPATNLSDYQRNIEKWSREVEQTFRKFEAVIRALVEAAIKRLKEE